MKTKKSLISCTRFEAADSGSSIETTALAASCSIRS